MPPETKRRIEHAKHAKATRQKINKARRKGHAVEAVTRAGKGSFIGTKHRD